MPCASTMNAIQPMMTHQRLRIAKRAIVLIMVFHSGAVSGSVTVVSR